MTLGDIIVHIEEFKNYDPKIEDYIIYVQSPFIKNYAIKLDLIELTFTIYLDLIFLTKKITEEEERRRLLFLERAKPDDLTWFGSIVWGTSDFIKESAYVVAAYKLVVKFIIENPNAGMIFTVPLSFLNTLTTSFFGPVSINRARLMKNNPSYFFAFLGHLFSFISRTPHKENPLVMGFFGRWILRPASGLSIIFFALYILYNYSILKKFTKATTKTLNLLNDMIDGLLDDLAPHGRGGVFDSIVGSVVDSEFIEDSKKYLEDQMDDFFTFTGKIWDSVITTARFTLGGIVILAAAWLIYSIR